MSYHGYTKFKDLDRDELKQLHQEADMNDITFDKKPPNSGGIPWQIKRLIMSSLKKKTANNHWLSAAT